MGRNVKPGQSKIPLFNAQIEKTVISTTGEIVHGKIDKFKVRIFRIYYYQLESRNDTFQ